TNAMSTVDDDFLKAVGKAPADFGKKQGEDWLKARQNDERKTAREAGVAYLDRLLAASSQIYEDLRERPPATATDAELVLLYESFSAANHNPAIYKTLVHGQVERYKHSHARKIGLHRETFLDEAHPHHPTDVKTKVAWIRVTGTRTRLAYMDQNF